MRLRSTKIPKDAVHHPVFARVYARMSVAAETRSGMAAIRADLLTGLSGRIIEIGAGNGLNFAHYPPAVSEVVAIEPEWCLRQLALRSALRAGMPVDVVAGRRGGAAGEERGVRRGRRVTRAVQRTERGTLARGDPPGAAPRRGAAFLRACAGRRPRHGDDPAGTGPDGVAAGVRGCHTSRDTLAAIERAGFVVEEYRRVRMPKRGIRLPTSACVLGVARRTTAVD